MSGEMITEHDRIHFTLRGQARVRLPLNNGGKGLRRLAMSGKEQPPLGHDATILTEAIRFFKIPQPRASLFRRSGLFEVFKRYNSVSKDELQALVGGNRADIHQGLSEAYKLASDGRLERPAFGSGDPSHIFTLPYRPVTNPLDILD